MIKRFSTLYVGHIELEHCGLSGTPADDRRHRNERLIEVFDTTVALARCVDALGMTPSGSRSITSSTKGMSASPTFR